MYNIEYRDGGTIETISANTIAKNILSHVDSKGHRQLLLDNRIDHKKKDEAFDRLLHNTQCNQA